MDSDLNDAVILQLVGELQYRDGEAHQTDIVIYARDNGLITVSDVAHLDHLVTNVVRPALDRLKSTGKIQLKEFCRNTFILV